MYCHGAKVATDVETMELVQLGWSGPMTMIVQSANRPQTAELRLDGKLFGKVALFGNAVMSMSPVHMNTHSHSILWLGIT